MSLWAVLGRIWPWLRGMSRALEAVGLTPEAQILCLIVISLLVVSVWLADLRSSGVRT